MITSNDPDTRNQSDQNDHEAITIKDTIKEPQFRRADSLAKSPSVFTFLNSNII